MLERAEARGPRGRRRSATSTRSCSSPRARRSTSRWCRRTSSAPSETADYCHTGVWSGKAIEEARRVGNVHVACTREADDFASVADDAARGRRRRATSTTRATRRSTARSGRRRRDAPAPLVCDASSDIFSRPLPLAEPRPDLRRRAEEPRPVGHLARDRAQATSSTTGTHATCSPLAQYRTYDARAVDAQHAEHVRHLDDRRGRARGSATQGGLAAMDERNARKARCSTTSSISSKAWRRTRKPGSRSHDEHHVPRRDQGARGRRCSRRAEAARHERPARPSLGRRHAREHLQRVPRGGRAPARRAARTSSTE